MSSQQHTSSRHTSHKPVENGFQRSVIAPDKPPRVRWHSVCYVRTFRNLGQLLLFLLFLAFCFVLGPSFISFMYPNVIIPFNENLDWKCKQLDSYTQLQASNLAWETNLKAGASAVNIQVYIKNKATTLDNIDKVLLVIDDCRFDDFGENVVLCRPIPITGSRPTFKESVRVAEVCYQYIRQMTKRAEIAGYGKGIAANILLATAVKLHDEYCYSFSVIFVEEPIIDMKKEFEESNWVGIAFMISWFRDKMMADVWREYGLQKADFGANIRKLESTVIVFTEGDYDSVYGQYGNLVEKGRKKKLFTHMKPANSTNPNSGKSHYTFRHLKEGECAKKSNIPLTSVMII